MSSGDHVLAGGSSSYPPLRASPSRCSTASQVTWCFPSLLVIALCVSPASPSQAPPCREDGVRLGDRGGFWLLVLCIVMDSLALLLVRCCRLLVVLLDFLIWSGLFLVARASDPDNVPYIDDDRGASCAGRRWRVCIARHVWSAPLCDTRLSHILVARAGLRRRLCVWRSLTLRAGSRVESVAS